LRRPAEGLVFGRRALARGPSRRGGARGRQGAARAGGGGCRVRERGRCPGSAAALGGGPGGGRGRARRRGARRGRRRRLVPTMRYREALNQALREEMQSDEKVFLMGEDIGVFQGAFKVTAGLLEEFGEKR